MTPPRARDLGIPFVGTPGTHNAITDVAGVTVGHTTLIEGDHIRTGVTAILPRGMARNTEGCAAAWHSLNGCGEMTGMAWVEESGMLEGPIVMTNTYSVGVAHTAIIQWGAKHFPGSWNTSLPVVGETYDGFLNDIKGQHVTRDHVWAALDSAAAGLVLEGAVGGGTGMASYDFKAGIGTSSRVVTLSPAWVGDEASAGEYTVGVLVQANHGGREDLLVAGVPVGQEITDLMPNKGVAPPPTSSILVFVATDAPLLPHQLRRLAKRATLGLARTGGMAHNWSGDLFLAFSTAPLETNDSHLDRWTSVPNRQMNPLMKAAVHATEEAIINALVAAVDMTGFAGQGYHAIPHDRLQMILARYGRLIA